MPRSLYEADFVAFGLALVAIALALYGAWRGYSWVTLASARDVEEHAREVIEMMEGPMAELGEEVEGVFELVDCGRDEYPGDGLRLVLIASPTEPASQAPRPFDRFDGPTTKLLTLLGLKDLRHGDEVFIQAKVYARARPSTDKVRL